MSRNKADVSCFITSSAHLFRAVGLLADSSLHRCRANSAQISQTRPDYGLGSTVNVLKTFEVVPSSLGSGSPRTSERLPAWRTSWTRMLPLSNEAGTL